MQETLLKKSSSKLALPTFLLIGAGKSGTTSLFQYLKQHPEVFMSEVKEPNFFELMGQKPVKKEDDSDQMHHYPWAVYEWDAYQDLFSKAGTVKARGEASTMYMYGKEAPYNIKKHLPQVKLIAILRDPVKRLYSRFLHLARENRLPSSGFADALDRQSIWWERNDLIREGFYYQHLSRYFELFSSTQIKIFLNEDLRENSNQVIQDIYTFIGVDPSFQPRTDIRFNESGFIKNAWKDKLIGQNSLIRKGVEWLSPALVKQMRNNARLQKLVTRLRKKNLSRPDLDPKLRQALIQDVYQADIEALQGLIGRDLSAWLE
ncbi:MAG: sulfotransferase domain-containing protein [Bacteroidota bacterium]